MLTPRGMYEIKEYSSKEYYGHYEEPNRPLQRFEYVEIHGRFMFCHDDNYSVYEERVGEVHHWFSPGIHEQRAHT